MSSAVEPTIHERLAAVREAAALDRHRTPEAARALLDARARQLARRAVVDDVVVDVLDLLVVQVGDERIAIPLDSIVAIARVQRIAPLPRVVAPVYGVTPWRGRPLTVLSLGTGRVVITGETRIVVLGTGARAALAVVVDGVDDVQRSSRADLSPPGPGPRRRYALGILADGLLVVNGDTLLQPETLAP